VLDDTGRNLHSGTSGTETARLERPREPSDDQFLLGRRDSPVCERLAEVVQVLRERLLVLLEPFRADARTFVLGIPLGIPKPDGSLVTGQESVLLLSLSLRVSISD